MASLLSMLKVCGSYRTKSLYSCWYGRYILIYDGPFPQVYVAYAVYNPFGAAGISAEYKNDKKCIELSW